MRALLLLSSLGLTASLAAFPSPTRSDKERSLEGTIVITKKGATRCFRPGEDGTDQSPGVLSRIEYAVVREQGDRLWVRHNGLDVWFNRSDAVPVAEAVEFFTKQIEQNPTD